VNKVLFISATLVVTALTYAASVSDVPEAQVSTPAEQGYSLEKASLTDQESASWQQKRVERKQAREAILTRLRNSSSQEKERLRQELSKNRNESYQSEGATKPTQSSRDRVHTDEHQELRPSMPEREMQPPPPPPAMRGPNH
jgi:predicted RNase H-like nuclease (RuvC/YqgF family)